MLDQQTDADIPDCELYTDCVVAQYMRSRGKKSNSLSIEEGFCLPDILRKYGENI